MNAKFLDDYLSRAELASQLGITPRTIANYENLPDGLPSMLLGGKKMYRIDSVRKWISDREQRRNPRRRAA